MNGKITYHQQVTYCGKPRCRKCRDGIGHGPYWYAYQTIGGQTTRTYIGKKLPPNVQTTLEMTATTTGDYAMAANLSSLAPSFPSGSTATSPVLRVWTLGQFRVERHQQRGEGRWQAITEATWQRQRSVRVLLGYLLCQPERKANRSQALQALWPDGDTQKAVVALNKDINTLRKLLGYAAVNTQTETSKHDGLLVDGDWLALAGQDLFWVDADAFEEQATQWSSYRVEQTGSDHTQQIRKLRETIALFNGEFLLEERDAEWAVARRQKLHRSWLMLQLLLADLLVADEMLPAAIDMLDRLLAKDPTNEPALQRLIVILFRLKRRSESLQAYKRFEEVLQLKYQAVPSKATVLLYDALQQGRELPPYPGNLDALADEAQQQDVPEPSSALLSELGAPLISVETLHRAHKGVLVGRTDELEQMRMMLMAVEAANSVAAIGQRRFGGIPLDTQRQAQCLFLMGDSGIGKTRLAEEMSSEAMQRGWTVLWSRLYTQESNVPYRVWTEILQRIAHIQSGLFSVLRPDVLQPLTALLPPYMEVLPRSAFAQTPAAYPLTPEQEQYRIWDAIGSLLKVACESAPVLIVLDDIQWADTSSHDLLVHLARNLAGYPILFLATCRDSELSVEPPHPLRTHLMHMQREHTVKTLEIQPLTDEQIRQLVANLIQVPEPMLLHIQQYAGGNPFFAEQLADSTPPVLPETITDALNLRMRRLSEDCEKLLQRATVLGGSFEFQLLCAMEEHGSLQDEDSILDLLDEARQAGVLSDEGTGTHITYHFWHPLLVKHLYDALSGVRKARLHQQAADTFLRLYYGNEERVAAIITNHLEKADAQPEQIAYYAELAGNNAYLVSAYSEAADFYQRAVKYVELAMPDDAHAHLISLLERLAECTIIRGNYAEARGIYLRVLDLRKSQMTVAEDVPHLALLYVELALTWRYIGDRAQAWDCCMESERILQEADIQTGPARARLLYIESVLYHLEGRYDEALRSAQDAQTLLEAQLQQLPLRTDRVKEPRICKTQIQRTLEGDPINIGRLYRYLGVVSVSMGQLGQALEYQQRALAVYEQYNELRQIAHTSCDMGYVHLKKAEYEAAQAALRHSLSIAELINDNPLISLIYSNQGELAAATGDLSDAEEKYKLALVLCERFQDREYISRWNVGLASVLQEQGKLSEASSCIIRAWQFGRMMNNTPCIGLALVALGSARIAQALTCKPASTRYTRLLAHAYNDVCRALELARVETETRLRGQLTLAHIALMLGKQEEAHEVLLQVIAAAQKDERAQIVSHAQTLLTHGAPTY